MPELTNIIYQSCKVGDIPSVSSIINPDYLKKVPHITKVTMLRLAVEHEHIDLIKFLLNSFKSIDKQDESVLLACKPAISMDKLDVLKSYHG